MLTEHETAVHKALNKAFIAVEEVGELVFPSLVWVWAWTVLMQFTLLVPSEEVLQRFMKDVDKLGIDMDLGPEIIEETLRDWALDHQFIKEEE